MPTVTIKSDNKEALDIICQIADLMQLEAIQVDVDGSKFYYVKGVKVIKAKKKLNIKKLSGAFPNLDMDPETFRKKLWDRNKEI